MSPSFLLLRIASFQPLCQGGSCVYIFFLLLLWWKVRGCYSCYSCYSCIILSDCFSFLSICCMILLAPFLLCLPLVFISGWILCFCCPLFFFLLLLLELWWLLQVYRFSDWFYFCPVFGLPCLPHSYVGSGSCLSFSLLLLVVALFVSFQVIGFIFFLSIVWYGSGFPCHLPALIWRCVFCLFCSCFCFGCDVSRLL